MIALTFGPPLRTVPNRSYGHATERLPPIGPIVVPMAPIFAAMPVAIGVLVVVMILISILPVFVLVVFFVALVSDLDDVRRLDLLSGQRHGGSLRRRGQRQ